MDAALDGCKYLAFHRLT